MDPQETSIQPKQPSLRWHWTSWVTLLVLVVLAMVRLRLLTYPLERDEGEYAYAGQLILQGIPPYELACNMKFPGTYAAYAAIMALFGQTEVGIHFGLLLLTGITSVLLYWLGKQLTDHIGGMVAAATYAVLAANPPMLALSGHATHFVVLFATVGLCLLWRAWKAETNWWLAAAAGGSFGMAVLMKQHAVFIGAWAGLFLAWTCVRPPPGSLRPRLLRCLSFGVGAVLPFGFTCLILWQAGVFGKFWFWTITYAREYASLLTIFDAIYRFKTTFPEVLGHGWPLWLLALAGTGILWFDDRLAGKRLWLLGFGAASAAAVVPGYWFREHYFIIMLPSLGLLAACVVSGVCHLWEKHRLPPKWSVWPVWGFAGLLILFFEQNYWALFRAPPQALSRAIYSECPFIEAEVVANFIRANSTPAEPIAVLGSEPEIYFLSHRHSATSYIYTYALMEPQPFAAQMQREMINDVEAERPKFIVYANGNNSWNRVIGSNITILNWWDRYKTNYTLVGLADIVPMAPTKYLWGEDARLSGGLKHSGLEIYFRK